MSLNLLRKISKVIKPELYMTNNILPHCDRDICKCVYTLFYYDIESYETYKKCYDGWMNSDRSFKQSKS